MDLRILKKQDNSGLDYFQGTSDFSTINFGIHWVSGKYGIQKYRCKEKLKKFKGFAAISKPVT